MRPGKTHVAFLAFRTPATCYNRHPMYRTQDLNVKEIVRLSSPREIKAETPENDEVPAIVARSRERIIHIL